MLPVCYVMLPREEGWGLGRRVDIEHLPGRGTRRGRCRRPRWSPDVPGTQWKLSAPAMALRPSGSGARLALSSHVSAALRANRGARAKAGSAAAVGPRSVGHFPLTVLGGRSPGSVRLELTSCTFGMFSRSFFLPQPPSQGWPIVSNCRRQPLLRALKARLAQLAQARKGGDGEGGGGE